MLKNVIRSINNRPDDGTPKVYSHQDWDHSKYNFDSENFNYDNFEVASIEDEQSAYLSICALANYSQGAVSSLGSLDAGTVKNVNLAGVNQHKACLSSIGSTMEATLKKMGNALNVRYTAEMEAQGLFGGEPGQLLDIAEYLRNIANENTLDILDQISGFGEALESDSDPSLTDGPQYDESIFTDPTKLASTYQDISQKDPSTWTEIEKYIIMAYYDDLVGRTESAKTKAYESSVEFYDALAWNDFKTLKAEKKRLEKMLKANGLMEYSGWEKGLQDIKNAGKALWNEGKDVFNAIGDGDFRGALHELGEFGEQFLATGAVVTESTISGVLKIGEYIDDGATMALTTVASLPVMVYDYFADTDYAEQMNSEMMDYVAIDRVGETRQRFYEGTALGQAINDSSALKWDSDGSQLIQDVSEKAGEVAIITFATVASGGTATPLLAGVGFLKGTGEEGERRYGLTDENGNYTNRTWKDTGLSYLSGLAEAAEWYGTSQAIGAATQGLKAVKQMGFDGIRQMVSSGVAGKTPGQIATTVLKGAKNSLLEADTWIDVGTGVIDFVVDGVNTGKWNWGSLAVDTVLNLGGNMFGGSLGEMLGGGGVHPDLDIDGPNAGKLATDVHPYTVDELFDGGSHMDDFVPDGARASIRYSKATTECMDDMEYAIKQYMNKYNVSRTVAMEQLDALIDEHAFEYMTSSGGARKKLMQYDFDELGDSLKAIRNADSLPSGAVEDMEYAIQQYMNKYNVSRADALKQVDALILTGDYHCMTSSGGARSRLMQYNLDELDAALNKLKYSTPNAPNVPKSQFADPVNVHGSSPANPKQKPSSFFEKNVSKYSASYGVDQGAIYDLCTYIDEDGSPVSYRKAKTLVNNAIANNQPVPRFKKIGGPEYFEIKNGLQTKYGLSAKDASILMSTIDDAGACSYAAVCNEVFDTFNGNPQLFEQKFGIPMYKTVDGVTKPNYEGLLVDMYVNVNMPENGGKLLAKNLDGTYSLNSLALSTQVDPLGRQMLDADNQIFLSGSGGKNSDIIDNYLKSKGLGGYSSTVEVGKETYLNRSQLDQVGDYVRQGLADGKEFSLGIYKGADEINIISLDGKSNQSTFRWDEGGGHAVYITDVSKEGFIVSSWGGKYLIPYDDLAQKGAPWLLNESQIKIN